MRIDLDQPRAFTRRFAVRDTAEWTEDSRYLSWAAIDFGQKWSILNGCVSFPTREAAQTVADKKGGYVTVILEQEET